MRVNLVVEGGPVSDGAVKGADVDEVKPVFSKTPFLRAVMDFELAVGGDPQWLNRRQISANHIGRGKLVGKVDGPNTSTSANVKHFLWTRAYGRLEKFTVEK